MNREVILMLLLYCALLTLAACATPTTPCAEYGIKQARKIECTSGHLMCFETTYMKEYCKRRCLEGECDKHFPVLRQE